MYLLYFFNIYFQSRKQTAKPVGGVDTMGQKKKPGDAAIEVCIDIYML